METQRNFFAPIVRPNPSITINTNAPRGQFSEDECSFHINVLELPVVQFSLKTLCHDVCSKNACVKINDTSAVATIDKVGSIKSLEMDCEIQTI